MMHAILHGPGPNEFADTGAFEFGCTTSHPHNYLHLHLQCPMHTSISAVHSSFILSHLNKHALTARRIRYMYMNTQRQFYTLYTHPTTEALVSNVWYTWSLKLVSSAFNSRSSRLVQEC